MIKGRLAQGGGLHPTLFIGLSRRNCQLLLEGKPIKFDATGFGLPGTVVIAGGETEASLLADLLAAELPFVQGYQCQQCQAVSYHPADIVNSYCGRCREFNAS